MPKSGYWPDTDAAILNWLNNASAVLTASPEVYGTDAIGATAFAAVASSYADAYATSQELATRTRTSVALKNEAKETARVAARNMASVAYGQPGITAAQLTEIGLTVKDRRPSPPPVMKYAPEATLMATGGNTARALAIDPLDPTRRAKPAGQQKVLFKYFLATPGQKPPESPQEWPMWETSGRTQRDFYFPQVTSQTTMYLSVCYVNSRGQQSPMSTPISVNLAGGGFMSSTTDVQGDDAELRLAA